jgi:hypothetical protein
MMTNRKLIYFKSKTICGSHALLAGEGFGTDTKVSVYSITDKPQDYFIIFVKNGEENRKTLHLKYSFEITKTGKEENTLHDGHFTIGMYGYKAVPINVDELVDWAQKGPIEFNMLRRFLVDAEALMSEWTVLQAFRPVLFKSLLSFLEVTPVAIRLFKKIYNDLTAAYYDYFANANGEAEPRQDPVFRYLDLCFDNQNEDWFHDREEIREQQIIEAANKLLIKNGTESKQSQNKDWKRKKERVIEKAQSWLLSRYNLGAAAKIAFHRQPYWHRWIFMAMPECLFAIVLLWLFFGPIKPISFYDKNWFLFIFYLTGIVGALGWVVCVSKNESERFLGGLGKDLQIFLPRLAAGTIVGYLVLLNNELWQRVFDNVLYFSGKDGLWPALARVILPLLGVLVYLYIETNKMTGHKISWKKPIVVFLRGCAYSALIGVAVSDVFGASMAEYYEASPAFQGFFGKIYPKVIFCHAPLALFIGVFLQLLWEDKILTEKI